MQNLEKLKAGKNNFKNNPIFTARRKITSCKKGFIMPKSTEQAKRELGEKNPYGVSFK